MPIQSNVRIPLFLTVAGLAAVSCLSLNDTEAPATASPEALEAPAAQAEDADDARSTPETWASTTEDQRVTTASGLQYVELAVGTGELAEEGWDLMVDYSGWLTDGTRFDSSLTREEPLPLTLGAGRVIQGWDEGIQGMRVGGRRQLHIPAHLGYGDRGAGGVIPPGASLIFDVELVAATKPEVPRNVPEEGWVTTESGLQIHDFKVGEGATATAGSMVRVHYKGWLQDGTRFDSSYLRGHPLKFPLGSGSVIAAWDEGIQGMQVGGQRALFATPDLAYGDSGFPGLIPPRATLRFDVELVEVASDTDKPQGSDEETCQGDNC